MPTKLIAKNLKNFDQPLPIIINAIANILKNNHGCTKSKDIGGYHGIFKCIHNCSYCYASPAKK